MDSTNGSKYLTPCRNFGLSRKKKRTPGCLGGQSSTGGTPSPLNAPFRSPLLSTGHSTNLSTPKIQTSQKTPWSSPLIAKSQVKMGLSKPSSKNHRHSLAALQPKDLLKSVIATSVSNRCTKEMSTRTENFKTDEKCRSLRKGCKQEDPDGARSLLDRVEGIGAGTGILRSVQKKGLKCSTVAQNVDLVEQGEGVSRIQGTVFQHDGKENVLFDDEVQTDDISSKQADEGESSLGSLSDNLLSGESEIDKLGCEDSPGEDSDNLGTFGFRGWDLENEEECQDSISKRNAFHKCLISLKSTSNACITDSRDTVCGISIEKKLKRNQMPCWDVDDPDNVAVANRNCFVILKDCEGDGSNQIDGVVENNSRSNSCSEESEGELAHRRRRKKNSRMRKQRLSDSDDDEDSVFRVEKASSILKSREIAKRILKTNLPGDTKKPANECNFMDRKSPQLYRKQRLLDSEDEEGPPGLLLGKTPGSQDMSDVALGGPAVEIPSSQESQEGPSGRRNAVAGRKLKLNRKQLVLSDSDDDEVVPRDKINNRLKAENDFDRTSVGSQEADGRRPGDPKGVSAHDTPGEVEERRSQNSVTATPKEINLSSDSEDEPWDFSGRSKVKKNSSPVSINKKMLPKKELGLSYSKERTDKEEANFPCLSESKEIPEDVKLNGDQESNRRLEKSSEGEDFERLKAEMRKWLLGGQQVIGEIIEKVRQQKEKELTVMDVLQEHGIDPNLVGFDPTLGEFVSFDKFLTRNDLEAFDC